ncbi:MAG: hypothetical protein ABIA04_00100 [Pseudomonadota bacterium]
MKKFSAIEGLGTVDMMFNGSNSESLAFPDTCDDAGTPSQTPTPYPNTGSTSDSKGSKDEDGEESDEDKKGSNAGQGDDIIMVDIPSDWIGANHANVEQLSELSIDQINLALNFLVNIQNIIEQ